MSPNAHGMLQTTITDADGVAHAYDLLPHPTTSGQEIMWALYRAGLPALLEAVGGALKGSSLSDVLDGQIEALPLGEAGERLMEGILRASPARLTRDLLRHALRDGERLDLDEVFDRVYARNYLELLQALRFAIEANRFLPLSAISGAVSSLKAQRAATGPEFGERSM